MVELNHPAEVSEPSQGGGEEADGGPAGSWPADGDVALPPVEEGERERALATAVAVAPCVAHLTARVTAVRGLRGHFVCVCETLDAYARADYWSGKTLEPQRDELPSLLSFLGSQRFGSQRPASVKASVARE